MTTTPTRADDRITRIRRRLACGEPDIPLEDGPHGPRTTTWVMPQQAGTIVAELTDFGVEIWVSGFDWPVALIDLFHRGNHQDPDDNQAGAVLVQLDDHTNGNDPMLLAYVQESHTDLMRNDGYLIEVLDPEDSQ